MSDTFIGVPIGRIEKKAVPESGDEFLVNTKSGLRVSQWSEVEKAITSGFTAQLSYPTVTLADGTTAVLQKVDGYVGGVGEVPDALKANIGKYAAKAGGYTDDKELASRMLTPLLSTELNANSTNKAETGKSVADFIGFKIKTGKNLLNPESVTNGQYIDVVDGSYKTAAGYQFATVQLSGGKKLTVSGLGNSHYGLGWRFNKADGSIALKGVGALDATSFTADGSALSDAVSFQFTTKTAKVGDNMNIATIQVEEGSVATAYEPFGGMVTGLKGNDILAVRTNENPPQPYSPIAKSYFEANALKTGDLTTYPSGKNKFKTTNVIDGYVNSATGVITVATPYKSTGLIPIKSKVITVSGAGTVHYGLGWRFLKADGVTVINYGGGAIDSTTLTASTTSDEAAYFQVTLKTGKAGDNTDINSIQVEEGNTATDYEAYKEGISKIGNYEVGNAKENVKALQGKTILYLGDSITTEEGRTNYPTYVNAQLGTKGYNYAWSGASFTDWAFDTNARQQLSVQIQNAIDAGITPDIVVIAIGTNDYNRQSIFSDYDTAIGKTAEKLDKTKVMEAARWAFWKIKELYPNAKCFYGNPLQRVTTPNSSDNYADQNGEWLRKPIEAMARRYGFTVVDQYGKSGIVKDFEVNGGAGRYLSDGLHPHESGKIKQSELWISEILKAFLK